MNGRYTMEELARISEEEIVRREFARMNVRWLGRLIAGFVILRLAELALYTRGIVDGASAMRVRDAILQDVARSRGGAAQDDDLTLVVARLADDATIPTAWT